MHIMEFFVTFKPIFGAGDHPWINGNWLVFAGAGD